MLNISTMKKHIVLDNEKGFASLVIGLILIVVIALLTVGFAQLTRHEQQQALNNLQATQAYYAAETGINDTVKAIDAGALTTSSSTCMTLPPPYSGLSAISANASYTCVMVDMTPTVLAKSLNSGEGYSTIFNTGGVALDHLNINWSNSGATSYSGTNGKFLPTSKWKYPAVIQLSITPLGGGYGRDQLINNTFTVLLDPTTSNSKQNITYSTAVANQGQVADANCNGGGGVGCNSNITGLAGTVGPYLVHVVTMYRSTSVLITGFDTANNPINFTGSQAIVDVTGKAWDVLKRLQVHVPLQNVNSLAKFGLEARDICKRQLVFPNSVAYVSNTGAIASTTSDPCYPG